MTPEFIDAARKEAATLARRLAAVNGLLAAYDDDVKPAQPQPTKAVEALVARAREAKSRSWADRPKDQFSPYGQGVVDAAVAAVRAAEQLPIKTRELADRLAANGTEIRGNDPVNALGALLARSGALESRGKKGWTLANGYGVIPRNENAPPSSVFDDVLGGAETAPDAQEGSPQE